MTKWQLIEQRILLGIKKEVQQQDGTVKEITAYTDPQTSEVVNTWGVQVIEKRYLTPRGVEHRQVMTSGEGLCSVMVFALTRDSSVILVKQYRQGMDAETIECPAGLMLDEKITYEALAMRELLEESGYGEPDRVTQLAGPLFISTSKADTFFIPFLATGLRKVAEQSLDSSEDIEVLTMPIDEWLSLIKGRKIIGACSIATTLLALMELKKDKTIRLIE